ncbi:MAG: DUF1573 domain-containing protein [Gemmataceae bacterium]|nr:DUF1573 domain-containing protein [Gemmataceae bacterium]
MARGRSVVVAATLVLASSAAIGLGLWLRARPASEPPPSEGGLSCGHWVVLRAGELLGVPISPSTLVDSMPASAEGHSLQDVADALRRAGLAAEGTQEDLETFLRGSGVRVVHLTAPDHFVVVNNAGPRTVAFLDHQGRRQIARTESFARHWSGHVLHVERTAASGGFHGEAKPGKPRIDFTTLFIDKGDLPTRAEMKSVRFEYPFRNRGHGPLTIKKAHSGCSCLKAIHPDKPVPPGGTGTVVLEYRLDPSKRSFFHDAVVETNDPDFPAVALRAAGNAHVLVTVSPNPLVLGDVPLGADKRAVLFVAYSGEEDFELRQATGKRLSPLVHSTSSRELADLVLLGAAMPRLSPNSRIIEASIPTGKLGPVADEVVITTNVKGFSTIRIPVSGRIVPPVSTSPSLLSFGEVALGDSAKRSLALIHHQGKPFRVLALKPETPGLTWSMDGVDLRLTATGAAALKLNGSDLVAEVEAGEERFSVEIPVFAARKPGS